MSFLKENKNTLTLNIYIIPRSSKSEIIGIYNERACRGTPLLKIKLKSPPVDNAANEELVRFLAEKLKIPKKNIEIVKGQRQKKKIVSIIHCNVERLNDLMK